MSEIDWVSVALCGVVGMVLGTADLTLRDWQTWVIVLITSSHIPLVEAFK